MPCRGEAENYILGTLGLRKITLYFYHWDLSIFSGCLSLALALRLHCKSPPESPSGGENPQKENILRIREGNFLKSDLNLDLTLSNARAPQDDAGYIFFIAVGAFCV